MTLKIGRNRVGHGSNGLLAGCRMRENLKTCIEEFIGLTDRYTKLEPIARRTDTLGCDIVIAQPLVDQAQRFSRGRHVFRNLFKMEISFREKRL